MFKSFAAIERLCVCVSGLQLSACVCVCLDLWSSAQCACVCVCTKLSVHTVQRHCAAPFPCTLAHLRLRSDSLRLSQSQHPSADSEGETAFRQLGFELFVL